MSSHQSHLLASGVQVNLDQLLDVVMAAWTEERLQQAETLKSVFQTVDIDNNGMLDIDEFVEVRVHVCATCRSRRVAGSTKKMVDTCTCSLWYVPLRRWDTQAMKMVDGNTLNDSSAKMLFIKNISDKEEGLVDMGNFVEIVQVGRISVAMLLCADPCRA